MIRRMLIGAAVGGGALNLVAWAVLLYTSTQANGREGMFVLGVHVFACFIGALLGGGLGLAIGAGLGDSRLSLKRPNIRAWLGNTPRSHEKGLSLLDVVTGSLYALTLTGVGAAVLLFALGGVRDLTRLVMDLSPLGSVGPGWALLSTLGSLAVATLVPLLAFASTRPPLQRVEGARRKLVAAAGFVSGVLWPVLVMESTRVF